MNKQEDKDYMHGIYCRWLGSGTEYKDFEKDILNDPLDYKTWQCIVKLFEEEIEGDESIQNLKECDYWSVDSDILATMKIYGSQIEELISNNELENEHSSKRKALFDGENGIVKYIHSKVGRATMYFSESLVRDLYGND